MLLLCNHVSFFLILLYFHFEQAYVMNYINLVFQLLNVTTNLIKLFLVFTSSGKSFGCALVNLILISGLIFETLSNISVNLTPKCLTLAIFENPFASVGCSIDIVVISSST